MKQKVKLVMATLFLLMTMTVYLFADQAGACKDCGSLGNCYEGNNLESGYKNCEMWIDDRLDPNGNEITRCRVYVPC